MIIVINLVYLLAAAAIGPVILYRMVRYNKYRAGWPHRMGHITRKDPALKKCIWIHAVSVGEVNATRTIVQQLKDKFPEYEIVITATTDTGFARPKAIFSDTLPVFYFPLDFSSIMNRAFRNIRPSICLLMELEVWPNFTLIAHQLRIPVVVVNGRVSDRSFRRYNKIRPIVKLIFRKLSLVMAQTQQYAQRFEELGCPPSRVLVTGSLKYDTAQIGEKVDGADELAEQLRLGDARLWVVGATGNEEEKIILDVYQDLKQDERFGDLRLVIVPRKPERFDEVAQLIEQMSLPLTRFSRIKDATETIADEANAIILGDTMGDLRKFYSLASVIFVGRSLVPMGGSDMAEAAALPELTMFGPHAFNFRHTVNVLLADEGAIMVRNQQELMQTMQKCLAEPDFAKKIAQNGQEVIRKNQGATEKSIENIIKILNAC